MWSISRSSSHQHCPRRSLCRTTTSGPMQRSRESCKAIRKISPRVRCAVSRAVNRVCNGFLHRLHPDCGPRRVSRHLHPTALWRRPSKLRALLVPAASDAVRRLCPCHRGPALLEVCRPAHSSVHTVRELPVRLEATRFTSIDYRRIDKEQKIKGVTEAICVFKLLGFSS